MNPADDAALKDTRRAVELDDAREVQKFTTPLAVGAPLDLHLLALEQSAERLLQIQQSIRALAFALDVRDGFQDR